MNRLNGLSKLLNRRPLVAQYMRPAQLSMKAAPQFLQYRSFAGPAAHGHGGKAEVCENAKEEYHT